MRSELLKPNRTQEEVSEETKISWEAAEVDKEQFHKHNAYLILLKHPNNPDLKVYAQLKINNQEISLIIPLADYVPESKLKDVHRSRQKQHATGIFNRRILLAFLNRRTARLTASQMEKWFFDSFGIKPNKNYNKLNVYEHTEQSEYEQKLNVSAIIRADTRLTRAKTTIETAIKFTSMIQDSLPLVVEPLSISEYLKDLDTVIN